MEKTLLGLLGVLTVFEVVKWVFLYGRAFLFSEKEEKSVLAREGRRPSRAELALPISIIICARNEAANLTENLPFILAQDHPDFELIVVDDASTDGTRAVLEDFSKRDARLRPVFLSQKKLPGKKAALAEGIRRARHELLLLTDADCCPASEHWASAMTALFSEEKEIVLGFAPLRPVSGFLNKWVRFEACWTALNYFSFARAGLPYMGVGRNLAYRKSLFEKTGGFEKHLDLASGDDDLFIAEAATGANTATCLDPRAFVFSGAKAGCRGYFFQKKRHFTTGRRYPWVAKTALGVGALSHALHYFLVGWLLLTKASMVIVLMCYVLRMSAVWTVWALALRRFRDGDIIPIAPVCDALIIPFHALFSPVIFFSYNQSRSWT